VAAVGAGALDVAVGKEAAVGDGIDLALPYLLDQAGLVEPGGEMLGEAVVPLARGAAEMVEGQPEPVGQILLHLPHPRAVVCHRLAGLGGGEFGGSAMFVSGADEHHLMPARPEEPRVDIGRQLRADQVSEMLDAVDVWQGRGDQGTGHQPLRMLWFSRPLTRNDRSRPERAAFTRMACVD